MQIIIWIPASYNGGALDIIQPVSYNVITSSCWWLTAVSDMSSSRCVASIEKMLLLMMDSRERQWKACVVTICWSRTDQWKWLSSLMADLARLTVIVIFCQSHAGTSSSCCKKKKKGRRLSKNTTQALCRFCCAMVCPAVDAQEWGATLWAQRRPLCWLNGNS